MKTFIVRNVTEQVNISYVTFYLDFSKAVYGV